MAIFLCKAIIEYYSNMGVINSLSTYGKKDFYGLLGFVFFGYFLLLSVILYKECIVHQDYAWELTWTLNDKGACPVYFRWGAIPWRIFFIVGPMLSLTLKQIVLLTSVWFVLSKFITWLICHFYFRNTVAGLMVIVSILFSHAEGFFSQNLQVYYAVVYFCFLFAVISDSRRIGKEWIRIALIAILLILIKGTHIAVLLACPPLFLLYFSEGYSFRKLIPIAGVGLFMIASQLWFPAPYEGNHMFSMLAAISDINFRNLSGILFYIGKQIIELNYLIPLVLLIVSGCILLVRRKYLLLTGLTVYSSVLFLLVVTKLITYNASYPLSDDVNYYIEGAFYALLIMFASIFFYLSAHLKNFLMSHAAKTLVVCVTIFYSSGISLSGLHHYEYNRYLISLMTDLRDSHDETIFIIDEKWIPNRFSRVNMNIEYETLVKSNLALGQSVILFITPYPDVYQYDGVEPIYINSISAVQKSWELDPSINENLYRFKTFNPLKHFESCNPRFFQFANYSQAVLSDEYLTSFNRRYGFSISEY